MQSQWNVQSFITNHFPPWKCKYSTLFLNFKLAYCIIMNHEAWHILHNSRLKLTPILLLLTLTHANNFKYNDPNTWNISLPESILQYLDYIDAIEPSTIFRNVSALDDETCNQDYLSIFKDLRENYQWPKVSKYGWNLKKVSFFWFLVLDAGNTASPGLLDGNRIVIGNYDECLSVSPPNRNFTGKHCLVYINDSVDPFEMDAVGFYWFR